MAARLKDETDPDERMLSTEERVEKVREATAEMAQLKPDVEALKQRKAQATAHCKAAKVRAKYRTFSADIFDLVDDVRGAALGELAIAFKAHDLPLELTLPVPPTQAQMYLFGENSGEGDSPWDVDGKGPARDLVAQSYTAIATGTVRVVAFPAVPREYDEKPRSVKAFGEGSQARFDGKGLGSHKYKQIGSVSAFEAGFKAMDAMMAEAEAKAAAEAQNSPVEGVSKADYDRLFRGGMEARRNGAPPLAGELLDGDNESYTHMLGWAAEDEEIKNSTPATEADLERYRSEGATAAVAGEAYASNPYAVTHWSGQAWSAGYQHETEAALSFGGEVVVEAEADDTPSDEDPLEIEDAEHEAAASDDGGDDDVLFGKPPANNTSPSELAL